mmetsp:Transcript_90035/g.159446  ORF Transcript_90035/g.159446 Transcript_90035/m.159446 type:complete len:766 (-) Transcript_90035:90-2387(-)
MASLERSPSPGARRNATGKARLRSSSTQPRQTGRSPSRQGQGRAQSQAPVSRQAKLDDGYAPNGWTPVIQDPPPGLLSHPLDSGAEDLFQCIFEKDQLVGLLAEPHARVRGLVVTSPGAGGGPGPADPEGGGGGGTYGGYNVYRELAARLPSQGIAVLLVHYPDGEPGGDRHTRVSRISDHLQTLTAWYQARVQWTKIPTIFIGWSMGGAVVIEAAARTIHAKRASICGVATIASQTAGILQTSPHLIAKSGCKLLLMAGSADTCLSPNCTCKIARMAGVEPEIFPEEDHGVESALGRLALWIPEVFNGVDAAATPAFGCQGNAAKQVGVPSMLAPCEHDARQRSPARRNGTHSKRDLSDDADASALQVQSGSTRLSRSCSRGKSPTRATATCPSPRLPCQAEVATPINRHQVKPGRSGTPSKLPKLPTCSRPGTANSNSTDSKVSASPTCATSIRQGRTGLHGKSPTSAMATCPNAQVANACCGDSPRRSRSSSCCRLPKLGEPTRPATVNSSGPAVRSVPECRRSSSRCNSPPRERGIWSRSPSADVKLSTRLSKRDPIQQNSGGSFRTSPKRPNSASIRQNPSSHKAAAVWDTAHKSPDLQVTESGLVIQSPPQSKFSWHAAFVQTPAQINARGSYRRFDFLIEEIGDGLIELGLATQNQAKKAALHWPGLRNTSAWTYASTAQRYWNTPGADEATWSQPFGEPYGTGDTISIEINGGELRFGRNGQMQGTVSNSLPQGKLFLGATLSTGCRVRLVSDVVQP